MTDFTERLELYREGGMITDHDVENINKIIELFKNRYGITLCEENADTFVAHLCAAYSRLHTNEPVDELPEVVMDEIRNLNSYNKSLIILNSILEVTDIPLNETEQNYALLHINNLLSKLDSSEENEGQTGLK